MGFYENQQALNQLNASLLNIRRQNEMELQGMEAEGQRLGSNRLLLDAQNKRENTGGLINSLGNMLGYKWGRDKVEGNSLDVGRPDLVQSTNNRNSMINSQYDAMDRTYMDRERARGEERLRLEDLARQGGDAGQMAKYNMFKLDQQANNDRNIVENPVIPKQHLLSQKEADSYKDTTKMDNSEWKATLYDNFQKDLQAAGNDNAKIRQIAGKYETNLRAGDKWYGTRDADRFNANAFMVRPSGGGARNQPYKVTLPTGKMVQVDASSLDDAHKIAMDKLRKAGKKVYDRTDVDISMAGKETNLVEGEEVKKLTAEEKRMLLSSVKDAKEKERLAKVLSDSENVASGISNWWNLTSEQRAAKRKEYLAKNGVALDEAGNPVTVKKQFDVGGN